MQSEEPSDILDPNHESNQLDGNFVPYSDVLNASSAFSFEENDQPSTSHQTAVELDSDKTPVSVTKDPQLKFKSRNTKFKRKMQTVDVVVKLLQEVLAAKKEAKSKVQNKNEFDSFGKSVADQLKLLPLEQALKIEAEIQNLISEKRIQQVQEKRNPCTSKSFLFFLTIRAVFKNFMVTQHRLCTTHLQQFLGSPSIVDYARCTCNIVKGRSPSIGYARRTCNIFRGHPA